MRRIPSRVVALLVGLYVGCGGGVGAAAEPDLVMPEDSSGAERAIERTVDKIDDQIDNTIGEKTMAKIEDAHVDQTRFFGEFFEKVDRIFGEEYVEDRDRKLRVRVGLETTFNDNGDSIDTALKVGLRVPLPAMKRRFNGFVDIGGDVNELGAVSNPNFSESEKIYSLAVGVIRRYRDNLETGLKLRIFRRSEAFASVYPFVRFETRPGSMRYFFEQQVIWESDNSWNTLTDFDVDRKFSSRLFLRLRNRVEYPFDEPGASIAHGLIVRQSVFANSGLSLEFWLEYNTAREDPTTIEDDTLLYGQLRLRGRIWRNWLEYELRPIYTIPTNTDRPGFFGFFVSLTVVWDSYLGGGIVDPADVKR